MLKNEKFLYPGYAWQSQLRDERGSYEMGLTSGSTYFKDPKRLLFMLSRYKFVSKMIFEFKNVLEVGCGDGFGSRIIRQVCEKYTGIDIEPIFIAEASERYKYDVNSRFIEFNILEGHFSQCYDAIFSLDVLEHLSVESDDTYFSNLCHSLHKEGVLMVGMPSIESQEYASDGGIGHINCKTGEQLRSLAKKYFHNVFLFEMNDEIVHTGFSKMAHYHIVLCSNKKQCEV